MRIHFSGVILSILFFAIFVSVKAESDCSLTVDGEEQQGVMVTSPGQDTEIVVIGTGLAECDLTLLLVGGGGQESGDGGAGSGHLEYRSLQVAAGTVLTARVGTRVRPPALPSAVETL